eukprot:887607-Rhodomonas_salina.1
MAGLPRFDHGFCPGWHYHLFQTSSREALRGSSRVIVFEFARSYTIEEDELLSVGASKRNQYQARALVQYPGVPTALILTTRGQLSQLHIEHARRPSTRQVDPELRVYRVYSPPGRQVPASDGRCPRVCYGRRRSSAEQHCSGPVRGPTGHRGTGPSLALRVPAHWHLLIRDNHDHFPIPSVAT